MKKKVVILGTTGFIGRAIVSLFSRRKITEMELYSKNGGYIERHAVKQLDISKEGRLSQCLKNQKIKTIIYLSSKIPQCYEKADWNLFSYNLRMHKEVLDSWQRCNCHLIYASSCSVYGSSGLLPYKEENTALPDNYYSISKFIGEILFLKESKEKNLPLTILRINAPYGIKINNKTVINIFIERAIKGKDIVLFGSGKREQDFIYIHDVAEAFWLSYTTKRNGIYNIATGRTITMRRLAELIKKIANSSSEIVYSGSPDPQENLKIAIDISKAQKELKFSPKYSLEEGLKDCISQYKLGYENRCFS